MNSEVVTFTPWDKNKYNLKIKIKLSKNLISEPVSNWIIMADRYPFKAHEEAGVRELTISTD